VTPPTRVALVEQYLAHRRRLGFALRIEGAQLLSFARFADAVAPPGPLTTALVVRWATQPQARPRRFPGRRLDVVRPFACYCAAFDAATEVPPRGLLGPSRRRPLHHIYTAADLATLLAAAQPLSPAQGLRPATYATLFGLLAASGLRVSEALRLTRAEADLAAGVLTIRATKFRKDRLVPLQPTTVAALARYAAHRDRAVQRPSAPTFFLSAHGQAVGYRTVRSVFRRLRTRLGWDARAPRPRIHDLRHTVACRRLEQWYAAGLDVAPRVAALATYLGHARVSDTYWYLTGTPTLLARAAHRFEAFERAPGGAP
jgi:integrase